MLITFLKLALLATTFNVAMTPINALLARVGGYAAIIFTFCIPLASVLKGEIKRIRVRSICLFVWASIAVCAYIVSPGAIDDNLIIALLSFFCCYNAIAMKRCTYTAKDLQHIFWINKLLSIIYIAYAYLPFSFRYQVVNEWGYMQFRMGLGNPNATAMSIMFSIGFLMLDTEHAEKKLSKYINVAMIVALLGALIRLQSRTIVICCLLYFVLYVCKGIKIKQYMIWGALLAAAIFMYIQIKLADYGELTLLGKSLATGRNDMFASCLSLIREQPMSYFLGDLFLHRLTNYHNGPLSLIMSFGFIGYACYVVFWGIETKAILRQRNITPMQRAAMTLLIAYFIHSACEAGPTLGTIPYGIQMILTARMAKDSFV